MISFYLSHDIGEHVGSNQLIHQLKVPLLVEKNTFKVLTFKKILGFHIFTAFLTLSSKNEL